MKKDYPFKLDVVSVRLVKDAPILSKNNLTNPKEVVATLGEVMSQFDREVVAVVNLKADLTPINVHFASVGTINQAITHPRELLKASILSNAASIIMIHCHPSGNLLPSREDTIITDRMNQICELMGINFIDHVIVAGDNREFFSFNEKGLVKNYKVSYETDYKALNIGTGFVAEKGVKR